MFQTPVAHAIKQVADSGLRAQVFTRLDALGSKLGVAATHLYSVLVRQAYAQAAEDFVWTVFMVGIAVALAKLAKYGWPKANDDGWAMAVTFSTIFAGVAVIVAGVCLTSGLKDLINPEFWAWQTAVHWVTGGSK